MARDEVSKPKPSIAIDFGKAEDIPLDESVKSGRRGGNGVMSLNICCADGNRKSAKLSKSLYEALDAASLQVLKQDDYLVIGEKLANVKKSYEFSNPTSTMIYHAALVQSIVKAFNLDFGNGRTSRSFQNIEIVMPDEGTNVKPYAIIDMSKPV